MAEIGPTQVEPVNLFHLFHCFTFLVLDHSDDVLLGGVADLADDLVGLLVIFDFLVIILWRSLGLVQERAPDIFCIKNSMFFWEIEAIFYLSAGTAAVALARKGHFSE